MPETCANCRQPIGALETPFVWSDKTVCSACYAKLKQGAALGGEPIPYAGPQSSTAGRPRRWTQTGIAGGVAVLGIFVACSGIHASGRHLGISSGELGSLMVFFGIIWCIVSLVRGT